MTWTALALRRVAVRCTHDRCVELASACDDVVEVGHFTKPQQDAVPNLDAWVYKEPVVVFDIPAMELKHKGSIGEQPFVLRATMITAKAEELLIPAAGRFDIAYGDHGLHLS